MIKVIIVDDQVLLRESIGYILDNDEDIQVIGMASDGDEAIKMCRRLDPDIILMDIEMPKMDGVTATQKIKDVCKGKKVIILTTFENPDNIMESFVAGADGYIVKSIGHKDLVLAVKCVHSGLTVIHESVKNIMIKRFRGLTDYKSKYIDILNEKEIRIVKHIASGKSNKEIAFLLNYSEGTIKNKVSKVLEKLNLSDRIQIAIFAIENGIT